VSAFPGAMFNAEGASLDATIPDLTEETLIEYPHRSMVARDGVLPWPASGSWQRMPPWPRSTR